MKIKFQGNEFWYGTCVKYGMRMPIGPDTEAELDLTSNPTPNQEMPLLVSTKGDASGLRRDFTSGSEAAL